MYGLDSERETISVSLRHLKLFESVARLSSVRRASEECHLSQPAVTQAIAKLEEQIGASLLERGASGSYLNPLGEKPDRDRRERVVCPGGARPRRVAGDAQPRCP
jgi:LysR family transcriptional regulator of gallate degradation